MIEEDDNFIDEDSIVHFHTPMMFKQGKTVIIIDGVAKVKSFDGGKTWTKREYLKRKEPTEEDLILLGRVAESIGKTFES